MGNHAYIDGAAIHGELRALDCKLVEFGKLCGFTIYHISNMLRGNIATSHRNKEIILSTLERVRHAHAAATGYATQQNLSTPIKLTAELITAFETALQQIQSATDPQTESPTE